MINIKKIKFFLYLFAVAIFAISIIFICVSAFGGYNQFRIPGYILIIFSSLFFLVAFAIDFRQTMIISKTEGDKYTFMSKNSIIIELKKREVDFEDGRSREYYIDLIREYEEIAFEINLRKRKNDYKN